MSHVTLLKGNAFLNEDYKLIYNCKTSIYDLTHSLILLCFKELFIMVHMMFCYF